MTHDRKCESSNLAIDGTRSEKIAKKSSQNNSGSTVEDQLTHDHKFEGSNLAIASTWSKKIAKKSSPN